jgi:predicted N-acetyltransferase YhbS
MIRAAEPRDAEALWELAKELASSFQVDETAFRHSFNQILSAPNACLAVAQNEGVVGYILGFEHYTFYANGRVAWVEEIIVQTDYRRKGIGTELIKCFEEWASAREAKLVALATRRATNFYQAIGYEESAAYLKKLL